MFGWFKKVIAWLDGPRLRDTYEDILIKEAAEKQAPLILDTPIANVVEPQITDAVTEPVKPKRARTTKGKFKADDKVTQETNEAWEGGKAPAKKPRAKKSQK